MKLLGRQIDTKELWEKVEARLEARGLLEAPKRPISLDGPEPFVEPLSFHLSALEAHTDPSRGLPLTPATTALGKVANAAKWAVRLAVRPLAEELFARQHLFNAHVRDAYAQLAAEVIQLKKAQPRAERATPATSAPSKPKRPGKEGATSTSKRRARKPSAQSGKRGAPRRK
jgi:hypothetical protein